jgi:choline dehydrogenase-like flavoprotein
LAVQVRKTNIPSQHLLTLVSVDWNFTSSGMEGLNGRSIPYHRGKALGGSSTLEFLAWTRGSVDDFDNWASVTGDDGWSWDNMAPYFKKVGTDHILLWQELTSSRLAREPSILSQR